MLARKQLELLRAVWSNERSYATTLLVATVDAFGMDVLTWDPRAIELELEDELRFKPSRSRFSRLMAAIYLSTSDDFFRSLPTFIEVCNILSGDDLDPRVWDPAELDEVAWGVTEASILHPLEEDEGYDPEIIGYVKSLLKMAGMPYPPSVLVRFAGPMVSQLEEYEFDFPAGEEEMFQAVQQVQTARAEEIDQEVLDRLRELGSQLDALELVRGNTKNILRRVLLDEDNLHPRPA